MKRLDKMELINIQKNMGLIPETIADLRLKKKKPKPYIEMAFTKKEILELTSLSKQNE